MKLSTHTFIRIVFFTLAGAAIGVYLFGDSGNVQTWTYIIVGMSFALYIGIAIVSKAASTKEFYVAGAGVPPLANGMATAADWMSAASFISMAGIIAFSGYDGSVYLMGWTGGYVLLALLLAPYLRKFGKFTVPDFIGDRYYSETGRTIAAICALIVSLTYIAGQMRGVGIVFSRFLEIPVNAGVIVGMMIVFTYATMGGMKGITYTQVAQYCVLIFAFMVPAFFISFQLTGIAIPQIGLGANQIGTTIPILDRLDGLTQELGFGAYTSGVKPTIDVLAITLALMAGTAGLPHVIVRFFTVPRVKDARISAGYALLFIGILYATAPAVAAFARVNLIETVSNKAYAVMPDWFKKWETTSLIGWQDKNNDGVIQYTSGAPFVGAPNAQTDANGNTLLGEHGQVLLANEPTSSANELYIDRDIMVLANPEIAELPNWVIALVAAGGLAAALSTAAGLLLVMSSAVAHDLIKKKMGNRLSEKQELWTARIASVFAILVAGYFGINPPGFVAAVVALAFGLAASSFFPAILLGIFYRRMNKQGAITGMVVGISLMLFYIFRFKFHLFGPTTSADWWFGISPEGFGTVAMIVNFIVALVICHFTPAPSQKIDDMISHMRYPEIKSS